MRNHGTLCLRRLKKASQTWKFLSTGFWCLVLKNRRRRKPSSHRLGVGTGCGLCLEQQQCTGCRKKNFKTEDSSMRRIEATTQKPKASCLYALWKCLRVTCQELKRFQNLRTCLAKWSSPCLHTKLGSVLRCQTLRTISAIFRPIDRLSKILNGFQQP